MLEENAGPVTNSNTQAPAARTVADIDHELAHLRSDQAATEDPQVAAAIERQRLQLETDRRLAVVVDAAQQRHHAAVRVRAARAAFEAIEADVPAALRLAAARFDAWVAAGALIAKDYATASQRLAGLHDVDLEPAPVSRSWAVDLGRRRGLLLLHERLDEALRRAGILDARTLHRTQLDPARTVESYVVQQCGALFREMRGRLPTEDGGTA